MWSKNIVRECQNRLAGACLIVLSGALWGGCGERENILVIEKPTEIHAITQLSSLPDSGSGVQPGSVIATLKPGDTVRALAVYHGQDHDGFKVKLTDGREGLIFAGDTFRVMSR